MKITLLSEESIRLEGTAGPLTIEAESAEQTYSPFHMLGSALGVCTYSILASWASNAKMEADDLAIEVGWSFTEKPHRIGAYRLTLEWPSLAADRTETAKRVAALCPIHATFQHAPAITIAARTKAEAAAPLASSHPIGSGR